MMNSRHLTDGSFVGKIHYNVRRMKASDESVDVSGSVNSWKERLPDILHGYSTDDIWNLDETGCFWRAFAGQRIQPASKGL